MRLERVERSTPELIEILTQRLEPIGIELVDAPGALGTVDDEPRLLEHAQMLGDGRAADVEPARELPHGHGPLRQLRNDPPAGGVAKGVELVMSVSLHLR